MALATHFSEILKEEQFTVKEIQHAFRRIKQFDTIGMPLLLNKQVVLITGASSGIGKSCATYLTQKGYKVYGTSRELDKEEEYEMIKMNVNNSHSVQEGISHILDKEGRIDIVINGAGIGIAGAIEDTSIEEVKLQFETNFYGIYRVCKEVLPIMRKQQAGCLINIGSIGGLVGIPFQGMYSASKYAIEGFTEALRMEVKPYGIRTVLIEPGDYNTGFTNNRIKTEESQINATYSKRFENALEVMEKDERNGANPIKIAILIERIINTTSPNLRYVSSNAFQRSAISLKRFMPSGLFEWIMMKIYKV